MILEITISLLAVAGFVAVEQHLGVLRLRPHGLPHVSSLFGELQGVLKVCRSGLRVTERRCEQTEDAI